MDGSGSDFTPSAEPWPPDYVKVFAERQRRLRKLRANVPGAMEWYRTRPVEFIVHWGFTYDPRNAADPAKLAYLPFVTFSRQDELIEFLCQCLNEQADALVEKCRDMGATWVCVALSVWIWRFLPGAAVGWGSRKQELVDRLGDADSIFEKIRIFIRRLPREFYPAGFDLSVHMPFMKVLNPETGSSITGEVGDNIGRGGRKLIYFKDESAHYERPELIEASLGDNTNIQIDISSVNGLGNVFYRRRKAGQMWERGAKLAHDKANIFVMDWCQHPGKTQDWYNNRRKKAENDGLLHKFAQEVERNYAASVTGVIIPMHHIQAAVDAHVKLSLRNAENGPWGGALDVADNDGTGDQNAQVLRKGIVLKYADQWGERDTGTTTRRAIMNVREKTTGPVEHQYDCIGMGSSVKAEYNRLKDEQQEGRVVMPRGFQLVPWDAGASCLHPKRRLLTLPNGEPDIESPLQKDFFQNLKAQGWWELARRFERTYRALTEPDFTFDPDTLISLDGQTIPQHIMYQLQEELGQAVWKPSASSRMMVDKAPEGTKSPNLGDGAVMSYWPVPVKAALTADFGVYGAAA
jgi:phage terminase large subunit